MAETTVDTQKAADSTGMAYLNTLPRRVVTLYVPLFVFMVVLLFPFYWMAVTTFIASSAVGARSCFSRKNSQKMIPFSSTKITSR